MYTITSDWSLWCIQWPLTPLETPHILKEILVALFVGRHNIKKLLTHHLVQIHFLTNFVVSILNSHPSSYIKTTRKVFFTKLQSVFVPHTSILGELWNIKAVSDFIFTNRKYPFFSVVGERYVVILHMDVVMAITY